MKSLWQRQTPGEPQVQGPAGRGVTLNIGGTPSPQLLPHPPAAPWSSLGRLWLSQLPALAIRSWGSGDPFRGVLACFRKWLSECKVIGLEVDVYIWVLIAKTARNTRQGTSQLLNFVYIFVKISLARALPPTSARHPQGPTSPGPATKAFGPSTSLVARKKRREAFWRGLINMAYVN